MEFHAVILCGTGHALSPFSQIRSSGMPKALLPIANRPMIEYVLDWCDRAFFPKVTVVTDSGSKEEIESAIELYKARKLKSQEDSDDNDGAQREALELTNAISVLGIDGENSGQVLYLMNKMSGFKSFNNFVLLPCDFITNLPPQVLIEAYRNREDSDLGLLVNYRNQLEVEDKKFKIFPKNYTLYSELPDGKTQLLDYASAEDVDFHKALQIRSQMTWRYPNTTISTKLLNASIFFGSTLIFKIFEDDEVKYNETYFQHRSITKVIRDLARSSWRHSKSKETVGLLILPHQATFFRNNNTQVLMEANRYFMKKQAIQKAQQQSNVKDKLLAHVGIDSLIGENTQLGEKTNVKRSVVGSNCIIGKRVKLTGSLVLNNVTIEDDVQLENCIIGNSVLIHSKLRLTNCNVESTHEVAKGTQSKGDTLLCFSLEGLVEEETSLDLESDSEGGSDSGSEDDYEDEYADNDDGLFAY